MIQRVAIVQRDIVWSDIDANLRALGVELADVKADVVVLSEMFQTGFVTDPRSVVDDGSTLEWMRRMAKQLDAAIVGSIAVKVDGEYRNRMYFVMPSGEVEYYDKRHLFSIGGEAERFVAGAERKVVQWRGVRYLLEVCYDLRFLVWSRQRGDYDAIIYSALWPKARREVWCTLLRARAMENQAYVVGVNRTGSEPTLEYSGDSMIVDYRGVVLAECGDRACISYAELDLDRLNQFKVKFNVAVDADRFIID